MRSPLEARMLRALTMGWTRDPRGFWFHRQDEFVSLMAAGHVEPVETFSYTLDIVILVAGTGGTGVLKIDIECDGFEFHERTREQACRDRLRNRCLTRCGWRVLRFLGAEIYADPGGCVAEVHSVIESHFDADAQRAAWSCAVGSVLK